MMKLTATLCMSAMLVLAISACKRSKDDVPVPAPAATTYDNYSNLKTGNYWIYQTYLLDTIGNVVGTGPIDSCYVEGDTTLNGHTYQKTTNYRSGSFYTYSLLRDSLSYIVDPVDRIYFSSTDFTNTFNHNFYTQPAPLLDTVAEVHSNMLPAPESKVVPAGFFNTLCFKTTYMMYPHYHYGTGIRFECTWYAKDIGMIAYKTAGTVASPSCEEMRLLRYHLN